MKYILLLLLSFNAYAEFKIDIVNNEGQPMSKDGFATKKEAQEYRDKHKGKWGKDKRVSPKKCKNFTKMDIYKDENGDTIREYHCPKNYTAKIEDITLEMDEKRAKKLAKKQEILDIKADIQKIKDSDLPGWHKRLLIKLARDLKEE
jgi:hypothetical protein